MECVTLALHVQKLTLREVVPLESDEARTWTQDYGLFTSLACLGGMHSAYAANSAARLPRIELMGKLLNLFVPQFPHLNWASELWPPQRAVARINS